MNVFKFIILYFLLVVLSYANNINLTNKELSYIKNNPIVKIGGGESFEPFIFKDSNGVVSGIDRDIADIIEEKTGLKIEFELGLWSDIQKRALNGELDGLSASAKTKEREKFYNYPIPYLDYTAIIIINKSNHGKISNINDVQNKRVAIQKDNVGFEAIAKTLGNVEIIYYETIYDVLNSVVKNEVDFTILDESIFYIADKLGINGFIETSFFLDERYKLYFPLTKEKPILHSIFNKALRTINEYKRNEIKRKWFKIFPNKNINFTKEEKEYLYSKEKIKFCIDPNRYPFEKIENNKHIGMSAEFLEIFEKEIEIPFELVNTKDWSETLSFIKNRNCDILPLAMTTPNRVKYLNFTKSYMRLPLVIATRNNVPFIKNIKDLKNLKLGIIKDDAYHELIKNKYPDLNIVAVDNIKDGLSKVSKNEFFGYIGALSTISYEIQNDYSNELKITGKFDEKRELSVAVRSDDKLLLSISEKLVSLISTEDKQRISNKYISVRYDNGIDLVLIYKIIAASFFIIILILFWNKRIQDQKVKFERLYSKLKEKDLKLEEANRKLVKLSTIDKLTNIYNRRKIDEFLIKEIERSKRTKDSFSLVMIDIDFFKNVNDTYGHQVGDEVLVSICKLINENIRKVDIFGRWGGEEFLIICPSTSLDGVNIKAERIRRKIEEFSFKTVGKKTVSLGITVYKEKDTSSSILKRVDRALYNAKENGRNRVVYLD